MKHIFCEECGTEHLDIQKCKAGVDTLIAAYETLIEFLRKENRTLFKERDDARKLCEEWRFEYYDTNWKKENYKTNEDGYFIFEQCDLFSWEIKNDEAKN